MQIKVYNGRKALAHALNDTKTAVKQLNKLVTGILFVVTIVVWLLLMEIATTKVLVFLSSQLVLAAFMFGNTCKTIFEAIVFVFVMHPFDVGDRCVVDGVPVLFRRKKKYLISFRLRFSFINTACLTYNFTAACRRDEHLKHGLLETQQRKGVLSEFGFVHNAHQQLLPKLGYG